MGPLCAFLYGKCKVAPVPNKVLCHEDIMCLIKHHTIKTYAGV
jgi:hypothetical protein